MFNGSYYILSNNIGRMDNIILSTKLWKTRYYQIHKYRYVKGFEDPLPSIKDLERTHIFHFIARFKPHIGVAFEYSKISPQSGSYSLGGHANFDVSLNCDFVNDIVGYQRLTGFYANEQTLPTQATADGGLKDSIYGAAVFPQDGKDWDNKTALAGTEYCLVNAFKETFGADTKYRNLVRYCEYPGERLYSQVSLKINSNELDKYDSDAVVMMRQFMLMPERLDAYKKLVGQETTVCGQSGPEVAELRNYHLKDTDKAHRLTSTNDTSDNTVDHTTHKTWLTKLFPSNCHNSDDVTETKLVNSDEKIYSDVLRRQITCTRGPQTPKYYQPALDIWNRLMFWFNTDLRLSLPMASIPYGSRIIRIDYCTQDELAFEEPGLFVEQKHVSYTHTATSPTTAGASRDEDSTTVVTYRPYFVAGGLSTIKLTEPTLYVNAFYTHEEIHTIYSKRISFTLVRVIRSQEYETSRESTDSVKLTLSWPVEYMFIGFRPKWNTDKTNPQRHRDWHQFCRVMDLESKRFDESDLFFKVTDYSGTNDKSTVYSYSVKSEVSKVHRDSFQVTCPIVNTLTMESSNVKLIDAMPAFFYSVYQPFRYQTDGRPLPVDSQILFVTYALYPGAYNPSGHLNYSRADDITLKWTTDYISVANTVVVIVKVVNINFVVMSEGNIIFRYSN